MWLVGTLILDLEAEDLPSIVNYVVNDMVIHDHIKSEHKGKVLKTLLMKHKYVILLLNKLYLIKRVHYCIIDQMCIWKSILDLGYIL